MKKYFLIAFTFFLGLIGLTSTHAASGDMLNLTNTIWTQGFANTWSIMATPIGTVIYFAIGIVVIFTVVPLFLKVLKYARRKMNKG